MKINKAWHRKNKMPKNPTLAHRIGWHAAHAKNCACRKMPESIRAEIGKRKEKKAVYRTERA